MRKMLLVVLTAIMVLALGGYAFAGTATDNMAVSATVVAGCTVSAAALGFGTYVSDQAANLNASADLTVTCGAGTNYSIALDDGSNYSAPNRRVNDGGLNYVNYALYETADYLTAWDGVTGTGSGTVTVYGRIPGAQTAPAGAYTDTVVATITW